MKTKTAVLNGKPDAGNPHVRFDEGEVASAKPRRGSLLYKNSGGFSFAVVFATALISAMSSFAATQTTRKATPYECEDLLTNKDWWTDYDAETWPNPNDDYVYTQGVRDTKCGAKAFGGRTFQLGIVGGAAGSLWGKGVNLTFLNEGLMRTGKKKTVDIFAIP